MESIGTIANHVISKLNQDRQMALTITDSIKRRIHSAMNNSQINAWEMKFLETIANRANDPGKPNVLSPAEDFRLMQIFQKTRVR